MKFLKVYLLFPPSHLANILRSSASSTFTHKHTVLYLSQSASNVCNHLCPKEEPVQWRSSGHCGSGSGSLIDALSVQRSYIPRSNREQVANSVRKQWSACTRLRLSLAHPHTRACAAPFSLRHCTSAHGEAGATCPGPGGGRARGCDGGTVCKMV